MYGYFQNDDNGLLVQCGYLVLLTPSVTKPYIITITPAIVQLKCSFDFFSLLIQCHLTVNSLPLLKPTSKPFSLIQYSSKKTINKQESHNTGQFGSSTVQTGETRNEKVQKLLKKNILNIPLSSSS
jgi:hypothetical protein